MIEFKSKAVGLKQLMDNMARVLPDPKKQRSMINRSLSYVARREILPQAQQRARAAERSGALAESISVRARSALISRARGRVAMVEVGVNRMDPKAAAIYANHYGRTTVITSGIRHGHLVEFGFQPPGNAPYVAGQPWLGPATIVNSNTYARHFAGSLKKKLEAHIRRNAKARGVRR